MDLILAGAVAFAAARATAALIERYGRRLGLIDVPNDRSSHVAPTPRGGGAGIAATGLLVSAGLLLFLPGDGRLAMAVLVGGVLVAGVGLIDDLRGLSNHLRLLVHAVAGVAAIWLIGLPPTVAAMGTVATLALTAGMWLCLVWSINAFNFMDGIDGIAASHAAIALSAFTFVSVLSGSESTAILSITIAAACVGFLTLNWSPASIFMGDVGSGYLGYVFGVLLFATWATEGLHASIVPVLVAPFAVDATFTLIARIVRGERWWRPHRSHVYQLAVQAGNSHSRVAATSSGLSLVGAVLVVATLDSPTVYAVLAVAYTLCLCLVWLILRNRWSNRNVPPT